MIYVTEPSTTGGVGAMGMRILLGALAAAKHDAERVDTYRSDKVGPAQRGLFGARVRPSAWFVSTLYPRQWFDIPIMLERMGVALMSADRRDDDPLVAFGGQSMIAPAPIQEFADVIALGDGERTGVELADMLRSGMSRRDIMDACVDRPGFWTRGSTRLVRAEAPLGSPRVYTEGRSAPIIEVARGCASKCAFCPIGWAGGSYREASPENVRAALVQLRGKKINVFAPDYSSVSWVEDLDAEIERAGCSNASRDARLDATIKSGTAIKSFNFGVEGWSERLRAAIGKPLSDDRIVAAIDDLSARGAREIRLYTIIGLPGEDESDAAAFRALLTRVRRVLRSTRLDITQTHLQCVPHTPFERLPNTYDIEAVSRAHALREWLGGEYERDGVIVIASEPKGRHLHETDAWIQRAGAEAWRVIAETRQAHLKDDRWRDSAERHGINVDAELRGEHLASSTPWDHVDVATARHGASAKALATYGRRMSEAVV